MRFVNDKAVEAELLERERGVLCFRRIEQLFNFRLNALLFALQVLNACPVAVGVKLVQACLNVVKLFL